MRYGPHDNIQQPVYDPQVIQAALEETFDENQLQDQIDEDFDMVKKPKHYMILDWAKKKILCQVRDVQEHVAGALSGMMAADMANAIKYLLRAPFKGNFLQDLKKCAFHVEQMIARQEREDATIQ